jgi:hypothetical protein
VDFPDVQYEKRDMNETLQYQGRHVIELTNTPFLPFLTRATLYNRHPVLTASRGGAC